MKKTIIFAIAIIAIIASLSMSVFATENTYTVENVEGRGQFVMITMNGTQAYCVQSNVNHPVVGSVYTVGEYHIENIEAIACATFEYNDGSDDFRGASQLAVWAFLDDADYTPMLRRYVKTEKGTEIYNGILELAKTIDTTKYLVDVQYYVAEGMQTLAIWNVTHAPMTIPEFNDDIVVKPTEPEPPVETVPETPEEPTVPEIPEETVPETPEEPVVPEIPKEPTVPEIPETPEETIPETPSEPEVPEIPEETTPVEPQPTEPAPEILGDEPYIPENPKTGDDTNLGLMVTVMLVSLICMFVLVKTNKKHQHEAK